MPPVRPMKSEVPAEPGTSGITALARVDAQLAFHRAFLLAAVGVVVAELDAADPALVKLRLASRRNAVSLSIDVEVLDVAILAPAAGVDQLQVVGIIQVDAEGVIVVEAARIRGRGRGPRRRRALDAGIGFQDAQLVFGLGVGQVGGDRPVVVDREDVVPAVGIQLVFARVAVVAQHRLHVGPGAVGDGAVRGPSAGNRVPLPQACRIPRRLDLGLVVLGIEQVELVS